MRQQVAQLRLAQKSKQKEAREKASIWNKLARTKGQNAIETQIAKLRQNEIFVAAERIKLERLIMQKNMQKNLKKQELQQ